MVALGLAVTLLRLQPVSADSSVTTAQLYQASQRSVITQYLASQSQTFAGDYLEANGAPGAYTNVWVVQFTGDVTTQQQALRRLFPYPGNMQVVSVRYSMQTLEHLVSLVQKQQTALAAQGIHVTYVAPDPRRDAVVVQGGGDPSAAASFFSREFAGQPIALQVSSSAAPDRGLQPIRLSGTGSASPNVLAMVLPPVVVVVAVGLVWLMRRARRQPGL
jgi:hypothetical protein